VLTIAATGHRAAAEFLRLGRRVLREPSY